MGGVVAADSAARGSVLEAVLERITFVNEETGYTIARVAASRGGPDLITVVGALLGAQVGESLRLTGRWTSHPKYGRQFDVHSYTTVLPATVQGIQRYLGSGLIKGPGLGPKRTQMIAAAWEEQKLIKEVMVFLQGVGVSTSLAVRIYKKYGDASISVVRNEPYRLASDVWGIGFKTADTIARSVGIPHDSPERIKAGLQYTLSKATEDGHCFLPETTLVADAAKILDVPPELTESCLNELAAVEGVIREEVPADDGTSPDAPVTTRAVYLVPFHRAERSLAAGLLELLGGAGDRLASFAELDWGSALAWLRKRTGVELAAEQEQVVRLALTARVVVLTGGPGCGKSFTVRSVVQLAAAKQAKIVLMAPTGRAAKRLSELTG